MTVIDVDLSALDPDLDRNDLPALVQRRLTGRFTIDEWGLDRDLVRAVTPLTRLRWELRIEGEHVLPEIGPALLVHSRQIGLSEPIVLAAAVARATDRPLRWAGSPDWGPLAPLARRLGTVPGNSADLRSLLRAGEVVGLPLGREILHPFHVGPVPVGPVSAAIEAGVPIIPVAVLGFEVGRWWTVRFGRPLPTRRSRGVVEAGELAAATRQRLQHLLTASRRTPGARKP
jgi:1-acyl-sn-glycerol-3-phosphate acyltransferase